MSKVSIIAAVDRRMAIGFQNKLLFWLPNDLKRFKALTTGNTIIMGRKTFESLPKGHCPTAGTLCYPPDRKQYVPAQKSFHHWKQPCKVARKTSIYISSEAQAFIDRHFPLPMSFV